MPLPEFVEPMNAKLVDSMRPGDWIYEVKFDGYRALALRGGMRIHASTPPPHTCIQLAPMAKLLVVRKESHRTKGLDSKLASG